MITHPIALCLLSAAAALLAVAAAVPFALPRLTRLWRRATPLGRSSFLFAALVLALYAGTKPPTNSLMSVRRPLPRSVARVEPLVCPPEIHAPEGYKLRDIEYDVFPRSFASTSFSDAVTETNWFLRGAENDWCVLPLKKKWRIALSGGHLRETPLNVGTEVGFDDGSSPWAVPAVSRLWYAETNYNPIVTWQNFHLTPDETISTQIIFGNPFIVRTNAVSYVFGKVFDPTNHPCREALLTLEIDKSVIYDVGSRCMLTLSRNTAIDASGNVRLTSSGNGGAKVKFILDSEKVLDDLDMTWPAEEFGEFSCQVVYEGPSDHVGDITVEASLDGIDYDEYGQPFVPSSVVRTRHLTAGSIDSLVLTGAGSTTNFLPFQSYPITITNSWNPGRHLLVPFESAWDPTNGFRDCSVEARLAVTPADLVPNVSWTLTPDSPPSGVLIASNNTARLVNPRVGGLYTIRAEVDDIWTHGNVLLPPAGAEIESHVAANLAKADHLASLIGDVSDETAGWNPTNRVIYGFFWFFNLTQKRTSYYQGRPNFGLKTVWRYNQVNDATGFGAVCTLAGVPIRLEKLSNLSAAYLCKKINVPTNEIEIASHLGTENDASAAISWSVGEALATGDPNGCQAALTNMVRRCWSRNDEKVARLWPLTPPADNYMGWTTNRFNYNFGFASPALLDNPDPFDLNALIGTLDEILESIKYFLHK